MSDLCKLSFRLENISQQRQANKVRDKIQNQREKRRLEEKLLVKGLAESDSDEDAEQWVEKTKRLAEQKALAEKRVRRLYHYKINLVSNIISFIFFCVLKAKALAELDEEFGVGELVEIEYQKTKNKSYNAKDLTGMKVMHDAVRERTSF